MGKDAGWAALNFEMTDHVPRTEYSAHFHWPLVSVVTGIDTTVTENRMAASAEFVCRWDYAWFWSAPVNRDFMARKGRVTRMGHAEYSEGADGLGDRDDRIEEPFADINEALDLDPSDEYGIYDRMELVQELESIYKAREISLPGPLHMGGVYVTMFSGLIEILGWNTFLTAAGLYPEKFKEFISRYYKWVRQFFDAYAESSVPIIMSHDDLCWTSGPVFHPDWYRENIFPYIKKLWEPLKEAGKKVMFTSDGNWTVFFDDIVACGADHVVMEPCANMGLFAERHGRSVGFTGNADTRILLYGSREEIENEVRRCMDIGKPYPGFVMAVGNHIPPNTPVSNALWYDEVYRKLSRR